MRKHHLLFATFLIFSLFVTSMVLLPNHVMASEMWQHTYGGTNDERAYSVIQTSDGGFALAGFTYYIDSETSDFYLVKTDGSGNLEWNQTYGGAGFDVARSVIQTSDGGYALAGDTTSFGNDSSDFLCYDFWLVKTDANGNMMWNKTYGYSLFFENGTEYSGSMAQSVVQTSDGGYALAGRTYAIGAGLADFYLVKTDAIGNMIWNQTYGGIENDYLFSMVQTSDGGYALAGYTESFGAGDLDYWLVKTDSDGNMMWNQTYGGTGYDEAVSMVQTSDDGYVLVGWGNSFEDGNVWLVKTDVSGNMMWNRTHGRPSSETSQLSAQSVVETSDGGYALTGIGDYDFWLIKTDSNGDILFFQTYAGTQLYSGYTQVDIACCLIETSDGDYALAGYTLSHKEGVPPDVLLVKTDHEIPIIWNVTRTPSSPIENSTYTNFIKANVYDVSGIKEVTLSYLVDDGSWNNHTMTNIEGNVYSAEIEAYPKGTDVFWTIIAENNIGKSSRIGNEFYRVIPEFPSWIILPLFLTGTLIITIYRKRMKING